MKRRIRKGITSLDSLTVWIDYCGECGNKNTDKEY